MAKSRFTLSSYDPIYAICEEVRIPEEAVRAQGLRWLEINAAKPGETAKLTDAWVKSHTDDFNTVEELLIMVRFNMYKDNREVQELADQDVICRELATRLNEELPEDLVQESIYNANARLEEMVAQQGMTVADFAKSRGISEDQVYEDVKTRTIQSLKEDSALEAYADHAGLTLEAEDFYAIIPGDSIEDKAYKRRQIELEGRLEQMEDYALKTKALKEIMANAMIKRRETDTEWLRYGDTSQVVLDASAQLPDNYMPL